MLLLKNKNKNNRGKGKCRCLINIKKQEISDIITEVINYNNNYRNLKSYI